jgi:RNA polymerase sigma-70 factor, ECF subfamily
MQESAVEASGMIAAGEEVTDTIDLVKQNLGHLSNKSSPAGTDFEGLFHEYWSKVCSLLAHMVGDSDEAEDLALEVFWRLSLRPHLFSQGQNLGAWIYRVATNIGYNAIRSRKRRQHYELNAGRDQIERRGDHNPAEKLESAEDSRQVREILSRMKPRSAKILTLRYSGLTYSEIADTLDVSVRSIGTLLARAEREFEQRYRYMERGQR